MKGKKEDRELDKTVIWHRFELNVKTIVKEWRNEWKGNEKIHIRLMEIIEKEIVKGKRTKRKNKKKKTEITDIRKETK